MLLLLEQVSEMEYGDLSEDTDFGALQQGFVCVVNPLSCFE